MESIKVRQRIGPDGVIPVALPELLSSWVLLALYPIYASKPAD